MSYDYRADQVRTGRVISSGSEPLLVYPSSSAANLQGGISFSTASIGADVFMFISGASGSRDSSTRGVALFGGDVVVSGTIKLFGESVFGVVSATQLTSSNGIATTEISASQLVTANGGITATFVTTSIGISSSGQVQAQQVTAGTVSATGLISGSAGVSTTAVSASAGIYSAEPFQGRHFVTETGQPFFQAGPGITISSGSNVVVAISNSFSKVASFGLCDYATTADYAFSGVGMIMFDPTDYSGSSVNMRFAMASSTGSLSASVKLWSHTANDYVLINGVSSILSTSNTTMTFFETGDLRSATNFTTASLGIYELQLAAQSSSIATVGGAVFRVTMSA